MTSRQGKKHVVPASAGFFRSALQNPAEAGTTCTVLCALLVILMCASLLLNSYPATARTRPVAQIQTNIPSVFETFADYFPIGAAIWQGDITGVHSELLKKHFNSITAENDMKPGSLQPTQGVFNFTAADVLVNFAKASHMLVRGHTLVWHQQNPFWLFLDATGKTMQPTPQNKTLLLQRLENHIRGVVSHYRDDVYAWDVVNEVIDPAQPDGFRRSQWFLITGTDYIDRAFQVAHEVAPNAKLYINDYDTTNPTKRMFLYNLVRDLKSRGVPIDGVGHQMHSNIDYPSAEAISETINMFSELGADNQITELDLSVYNNSTASYSTVPEEVLIKQGTRYRDFFQAFRQLKGKLSSVTFWGQADDHTWLKSFPITRLDLPLLFDEQLQAKYAYWGAVDPSHLPGAGADLASSISADFDTVLSGQAVSYTITVTNNGPDPAADVSLVNAIPNQTVFQSLVAPAGWSCATPSVGNTGQVSCTTNSLTSGASAQINLTVTVACGAPHNTQIVNSATVTSATTDPSSATNNTASVNIRVFNPPPVIVGLAVDKPVLAPANHQMEDITLTYSINDNCDVGLIPNIMISSDQAPSGMSADDLAPDWEIVDAHHIRLRAERMQTSRAGPHLEPRWPDVYHHPDGHGFSRRKLQQIGDGQRAALPGTHLRCSGKSYSKSRKVRQRWSGDL